MPHLRLEYAVGTDDAALIETLVTKLHAQMVASSVFPTAGIRVRAFKADHAIVADGDARNGFVAMQLSVGAGRSTEVLKVEGDQLFQIAQSCLADQLAEPYFALSLEIHEINGDLSWKDTPIHARLSKPKG